MAFFYNKEDANVENKDTYKCNTTSSKPYGTEVNVSLQQQVKLRNLTLFLQNSVKGKLSLTQVFTPVLTVYEYRIKQTGCLFMYISTHFQVWHKRYIMEFFILHILCMKDRDLFLSQPGGKQVHIYKIVLLLGDAQCIRS